MKWVPRTCAALGCTWHVPRPDRGRPVKWCPKHRDASLVALQLKHSRRCNAKRAAALADLRLRVARLEAEIGLEAAE